MFVYVTGQYEKNGTPFGVQGEALQRIPGPVLKAIEALDLPAMPQVLLRFHEEAGSDSASMDALAQLVMSDPTLSARILTVANSAAFRRGGAMQSIKQSLIALGTRMVRTIASCLIVQSVFGRLPGAHARDLTGFWRHSLLVAEFARALAVEGGDIDGEEAYLAGLLHDVGQLMLLGGLGDRYRTLLARSGIEARLVAVEQPELETDHGAVAAWLVDQWQLPSLMADAILFHHQDAERIASADVLTRVLWSAHAGSLIDPQQAAVDETAATAARLASVPQARFAALRAEAAQRVDALAGALGVGPAELTHTLPLAPGAIVVSPAPAPDAAESQMQSAVSTLAAMQPLQQNLFGIESDVELLLAVRESVRILFGVSRLAFLLARDGGRLLSGRGIGGQPAVLQRIEVPVHPGHSLAADAAIAGQAKSSFDAGAAAPPSLTDLQIARALGSDGLLCVPMATGQGLVGVMLCGLSAAQDARLRKRLTWLRSFATLTASSLEAWHKIRERDAQIEAEVAGRFRLQGRKVAHEAANPLGIIKTYLQIVDRRLPDASGLSDELAVLREEIDRVSTIVRQLGDAAPPVPAGLLDVNGLVEGMRALYGESLFGAAGITLALELAPQATLTRADRDSVKQILFNLWKNAAEAAPAGSRVTTTTAVQVDPGGVHFIELRVIDVGPGLPREVKEALFRPLDAARRPGRAGLGLAIVHSLVEKMGGSITYDSMPGQGTTFVVKLPGPAEASR